MSRSAMPISYLVLFLCVMMRLCSVHGFVCTKWEDGKNVCLWNNKVCTSHLKQECSKCMWLENCKPFHRAKIRVGGNLPCFNESCPNNYQYSEWQGWSAWNNNCPSTRTRKQICTAVPLYDNSEPQVVRHCVYNNSEQDDTTRMCKTSWIVMTFILLGGVFLIIMIASSMIRYWMIRRRARRAVTNNNVSRLPHGRLATVSYTQNSSFYPNPPAYVNNAMMLPPPPYPLNSTVARPTAPSYQSVVDNTNETPPKDGDLPTYEQAMSLQPPPSSQQM